MLAKGVLGSHWLLLFHMRYSYLSVPQLCVYFDSTVVNKLLLTLGYGWVITSHCFTWKLLSLHALILMLVLVIFISTMAPVGMMLSLWKVQSINNNPTLETNGFPTSPLLLGIVCLMAGTNMIYMLSNDSCDPVVYVKPAWRMLKLWSVWLSRTLSLTDELMWIPGPVTLRLMTPQFKDIVNHTQNIIEENTYFTVYGFKILCEISTVVPCQISNKILNPVTTKYAFYKIWC